MDGPRRRDPRLPRTLRLLALVMICVVTATVVAPERAEAIDPMTAIAIGTAAVGVLILVIFLVVANVADAKRAAAPVYYACVETAGEPRACWPVERGDVAAWLAPPAPES